MKDMNKYNKNEKEIPLKGGRITEGVVKIGNTVHRPVKENSEFVHKFLKHLEKVNFEGAPQFLGIDEKGREILSFIEGQVPADLGYWNDDQIVAASQLIRCFHDATKNSNLGQGQKIICHYDLSPCNTVFKEGKPVAFIDFDAAAPGSRISDLAYAIWLWLDFTSEHVSVKDQGNRIRLMCEAYGLKNKSNILEEIINQQYRVLKSFKKLNTEYASAAINWVQTEIDWVKNHFDILKNTIK